MKHCRAHNLESAFGQAIHLLSIRQVPSKQNIEYLDETPMAKANATCLPALPHMFSMETPRSLQGSVLDSGSWAAKNVHDIWHHSGLSAAWLPRPYFSTKACQRWPAEAVCHQAHCHDREPRWYLLRHPCWLNSRLVPCCFVHGETRQNQVTSQRTM